MIPSLKERFLAPAGWDTHSFHNPQTKHTIHFGKVFPQRDAPPAAIVVCLQGLSEFMEKYYEVAHDMLDRNCAFWTMDWQYQGRSGRHPKEPSMRYSDGFDSDISDVRMFVDDYVLPAAGNPKHGKRPLFLLGHSTGGNIGPRYLSENPGRFNAAAFTAPFWGTNSDHPLRDLYRLLTSRKDWHEALRKSDGTDKFSSDPVRDAIHNAWCKADPALRIDQASVRWVWEAIKSCKIIQKPGVLEAIDIPVLIAAATKDEIVGNDAIYEGVKRLPKGILVRIEDARHEILMEREVFRNQFLNPFDKLLEQLTIAPARNFEPA